MQETIEKIRTWLREHHMLFEKAIPLIASENVTSPAVREALISDFHHRYAEGWVGERVYAGCSYIDKVENLCLDLLKDVFKCPFADVRPISGVFANLVIYTAFTEPGDKMMAISIPVGGHISFGPKFATTGAHIGGTAGSVSGLDVKYIPFDRYGLNIDIDKAQEEIRKVEPKLIQFGASVFLFPHPIRELKDAAKEVGAHINYDSAHVAGLIAGGKFQDPLREGVDTMTMSTHKTFFGPQKGAVLSASDDEDTVEKIKKAAFPGLSSNHHLHNVAGLTIALAEFKEFGEAYVSQVIANAKALGQALYERGFKVICPENGFTESHTLLIDISDFQSSVGLGGDIEVLLEKANIIINRNLLPWDIFEKRNYMNPGGIRLGTSEVTRLGMKESEMDEIAVLMKKVVFDNKSPESIQQDVSELRKGFQDVHYAFPSSTKAYDYIEIA